MSKSSKSFDCVQSMREARDRISSEIAGLSYDEKVDYFRNHRFSDPGLQRLADRAKAKAAEVAAATKSSRIA